MHLSPAFFAEIAQDSAVEFGEHEPVLIAGVIFCKATPDLARNEHCLFEEAAAPVSGAPLEVEGTAQLS